MIDNSIKFGLAKKLHLSGKIEESQKIYLQLATTNKKNHELFFLLGTTFLQLKNYDNAINNFNKSISINSNFPNTYNNKGIALAEKHDYSEAIINYDKAIKLKKDYADAYLNKGISLNKLKRFSEAIKYFKLLIKVKPLDPKIYNNLGNVYKNLKNYNEAINAYEKAIKIKEKYFEAISNKADVLHSLKKYDEALVLLDQIFKEEPDFWGLSEKIISNKMFICEWEEFDKIKYSIKNNLLKNEIAIAPLFIHYLFDDPELHKLNSEAFVSYEFKNVTKTNTIKKKKKKNKIKIGYFSGDFHNHPVLHIMTNIFKNHDKSNFELYAFSHGPEKKENIWRKNIEKYFKDFFIINEMSDEDVIKLSENNNIDIAVNLTGLTKHDRTGVFFRRVAPIQINYLGYPGTIGLDSMDYIIADKNIIPENHKKYYTEEIEYLPKCYIPSSNDVLLGSSKKNFIRSEFNLPENSIVFCAFHNPLKINPELFYVWMNILEKTKNSVLWIKTNNKSLEKNIKKEAQKKGIDVGRIIIAEGLKDINDHIERLKLADIFLDSYPYNSHSTTYDYIRAELPMIIWRGNTFSSRVASSIYSSIDMDELIANNKLEYENIAIELANDKLKLDKIKNKLIINTKKFNLFNNKEITKELEKIYKRLLNNRY
jgi:protein O-GlcNAc transferase